jgi:hypothetical protein
MRVSQPTLSAGLVALEQELASGWSSATGALSG